MKYFVLIPLVAAFILGCFGTVRSVMEIHSIRLGYRTLSWPATSGTITRAEIKGYVGSPNGGYDCEYEYIINGKKYANMRVASYRLSKGDTYMIIAGMVPGQKRTVFYDPQDPGHAVLVRGPKYTSLLINISFVIGSLVILIGAWKGRNDIVEALK